MHKFWCFGPVGRNTTVSVVPSSTERGQASRLLQQQNQVQGQGQGQGGGGEVEGGSRPQDGSDERGEEEEGENESSSSDDEELPEGWERREVRCTCRVCQAGRQGFPPHLGHTDDLPLLQMMM